jgi:two-component system CheB/CheR fusion protein
VSEDRAFEELLSYLKTVRGFDFTDYKRASLERRIDKRMGQVGVDDYAAYQDYLEVHPDEFASLFDTILINVTAFYRDPAAWAFMAEEAIPAIERVRGGKGQIRVWSAGCASGEEAYTTAMVFAEALGIEAVEQRVKIYATDADEDALATARHGVYTAKELEGLPEELRTKYFDNVGSKFAFKKGLRRSVIFGRHDLVQDAPISRLDLLISRNTLMYFNANLQRRIIANYHFALLDHGFLMLGKAETLLTSTELFAPIDLRQRLFTKMPATAVRERVFGLPPNPPPVAAAAAKAVQLRDAAIDAGPVAQVLVDVEGVLVHTNQQAKAVFDIGSDALGRPFQDTELSYRPLELRSRIEAAYAERRQVVIANVDRADGDGDIQTFDVVVAPVFDSEGGPIGVMITFADVTRYRRLRQEVERSNQELETAYEELQSTNEELETTNEELQSTVEELETTNEELQSANEELETTNEELQSTNAEIQAMNDDMRMRTADMNQLMSLSEGIVETLHLGIAVVDRDMLVRTWNARAAELWGVREDEVVGKPFFELDIGLPVEELREAISRCIEGEGCAIRIEATNRRGRAVQCDVRCSPLRNEGGIGGAVILMDASNRGPSGQ